MDGTEIGTQAARVMSYLDDDQRSGALPDNARVVAATVVYEVAFTDEDGEACSQVGLRTTDNRSVVALGLLERARDALLNPKDD